MDLGVAGGSVGMEGRRAATPCADQMCARRAVRFGWDGVMARVTREDRNYPPNLSLPKLAYYLIKLQNLINVFILLFR